MEGFEMLKLELHTKIMEFLMALYYNTNRYGGCTKWRSTINFYSSKCINLELHKSLLKLFTLHIARRAGWEQRLFKSRNNFA